jgi:hypothetical protein
MSQKQFLSKGERDGKLLAPKGKNPYALDKAIRIPAVNRKLDKIEKMVAQMKEQRRHKTRDLRRQGKYRSDELLYAEPQGAELPGEYNSPDTWSDVDANDELRERCFSAEAQGLFSGFRIPITHSIDDKDVDKISELTDVFKRLDNKIPNNVTELMGTIESKITNLSNTTSAIVKGFLSLVPFAIAACGAFYFRTKKWIAAALGLGTVVLGVNGKDVYSGLRLLIDKIIVSISSLKEVVPEKADGEPQSFLDDCSFDTIKEFLFSNIFFKVLNKMPSFKQTSSFLKESSKWWRIKDDLSSIIDSVWMLIQKAYNWIRTRIFGLDAVMLFRTEREDVNRWCDEILDFVSKTKHGIEVNVDNATTCWSLKARGLKFCCEVLRDNKRGSAINSVVVNYLRLLNEVAKIFDDTQFADGGPRMEPYTILLAGKSGIGKSAMTIPLICQVLTHLLNDDDYTRFKASYDDFVWNREPEHVYADGYHGQRVIVKDDFGQTRDVAGQPDNEYMEVIRDSNMFPHKYHAAEIEKKGKLNCKAWWIIGTTNLTSITPSSIHEPEAVQRRWNVFRPTVKIEFATPETFEAPPHERKLDKTKLTSGLAFQKDIYEFYECDQKDFKSLGNPYSFDEFVMLCVENIKKNKDQADKYLEQLTLDMDEARRQAELLKNSQSASSSLVETITKRFQKRDVSVNGVQISEAQLQGPVENDEVDATTVVQKLVEMTPLSDQVDGSSVDQDEEDELDKLVDGGLDFSKPVLETNFPMSSDDRTTLDKLVEMADKFTPNPINAIIKKIRLKLRTFSSYSYARTGVEWVLQIYRDNKQRFTRALMGGWDLLTRYIVAFIETARFRALAIQEVVVKRDIKHHLFAAANFARDRLNKHYDAIKLSIDNFIANHPNWTVFMSTITILPILHMMVGLMKTCITMFLPSAVVASAKVDNLIHKHSELDKFIEKNQLERVALVNKRTGVRMVIFADKRLRDFYSREHYYYELTDVDSKVGMHGADEMFAHTDENDPVNTRVGLGKWLMGADADHPPMFPKEQTNQALYDEAFDKRAILDENFQPQSYDREGRVKHMQRKLRRVKVDKPPSGEPQGAFENMRTMANNVAKRNMYNLFVFRGDEETCFGMITFIRDNIAVCPYHFVRWIQARRARGVLTDDTRIVLEAQDPEFNIDLIAADFNHIIVNDSLKANDTILISFPVKKVRCHRNIISYFVSKNHLYHDIVYDIVLMSVISGNIQYQCGSASIEGVFKVSSASLGEWTLKNVFNYNLGTVFGDCGSLCFSRRGEILGMHVAGSQKTGFGASVVITRESLIELLGKGDAQMGQNYHNNIPRGFLPHPVLKMDPPVQQVIVSKIRRSRLYEAWGPALTAPAKLGAFTTVVGTLIDPLIKAVNRYHKEDMFEPDMTYISAVCSQWYSEMMNAAKSIPSPKILTFDEAVVGRPGIRFFEGIPRGTSMGYPYAQTKNPKFKGKTEWFGVEDEYQLDNEMVALLRLEVARAISQMRDGAFPDLFFTHVLKDERRKKHKVESGDTRLFGASNAVLLIAMRELFMDFVVFMQEGRIHNGIAVGINPYSEEWDSLYKKLTSKGSHHFAGDYTGYDLCQWIDIYLVILHKIIQPFYNDGEANHRAREVCFRMCIHGWYVTRDMGYQLHDSLATGVFGTALWNSMYNIVCFRAAFVHAIGDVRAITEYRNHVYTIAFGDDNVVNVSHEVAHRFNQVIASKVLKQKFNLNYGSDQKEDKNAMQAFRPLTELTFLKRKWRYDDLVCRFVAPLELDVILEAPYWTKKGDLQEVIERDNVNFAIRELSLHDDLTYYKHLMIIKQAAWNRMRFAVPELDRAIVLSHALNQDRMFGSVEDDYEIFRQTEFA